MKRAIALLLAAWGSHGFAPRSSAVLRTRGERTVAHSTEPVKGPYFVDDPWKRESEDEEDFSNLVPDERGLLTYPIPDGYFKTENIPGKMPIDEETKRLKEKDLDELKRRWVRMRELREYESERLTGFSEKAEILNGRFAMFFLVTGLLTELWTGETVPDQIATMGRTLGFIGLG